MALRCTGHALALRETELSAAAVSGPVGYGLPMRRCWVQWLSRPSRSNPGETLRWVRCISLLVGVFGFGDCRAVRASRRKRRPHRGAHREWLLSASTWVTLKPAIRRADEHGGYPPKSCRMRDAGNVAASVFTAALLCIALPLTGYVLEGVAGAATFFVVGGPSASDSESGSPPAALPIDPSRRPLLSVGLREIRPHALGERYISSLRASRKCWISIGVSSASVHGACQAR